MPHYRAASDFGMRSWSSWNVTVVYVAVLVTLTISLMRKQAANIFFFFCIHQGMMYSLFPYYLSNFSEKIKKNPYGFWFGDPLMLSSWSLQLRQACLELLFNIKLRLCYEYQTTFNPVLTFPSLCDIFLCRYDVHELSYTTYLVKENINNPWFCLFIDKPWIYMVYAIFFYQIRTRVILGILRIYLSQGLHYLSCWCLEHWFVWYQLNWFATLIGFRRSICKTLILSIPYYFVLLSYVIDCAISFEYI